ncbi:MAG TPA: MerR family transcriptional regulator [Pyrinomonadaceae bacterium]|nr:MerR family transcriptional regulator [Pyrinomonadaceae bacterium]
MAGSELHIGEVAVKTGVSVDTVRYYERRSLLPRAARTGGRFRVFGPEAVGRILFIKQAQGLGFSLDEIRHLLNGGGDGAGGCRSMRDLLRAKIKELDGRMKAMKEFRVTLADHLAACDRELRRRRGEAECPVMVEISHARPRKRGPKGARK